MSQIRSANKFVDSFGKKEYITYNNVLITCIDPNLIVGQHSLNKLGNSFMNLIILDEDSSLYKEYAGPRESDVISMLPHYSMGFRHSFYNIIGSYSKLLEHKSIASTDYKILNFISNNNISKLSSLIGEIENKLLLFLNEGQSVLVKNLSFFKPTFTPLPIHRLAVDKIKLYLSQIPNDKFSDRLAILKTYNNVNFDKFNDFFNKFQISLIDPDNVELKKYIKNLMDCKFLIVDWTFTSPWHIFLPVDSKCYCLVREKYWAETCNNGRFKNFTFNAELFSNIDPRFLKVDNNFNQNNLKPIEQYIESVSNPSIEISKIVETTSDINKPDSIPVPIFIVTRDRLDVLLKSIESFKQLNTNYEIIVHDNLSTFKPLIDYLKNESDAGNLTVYWNKRNVLEDVGRSISDYYRKGCKSDFYVVTDPDIQLMDIEPDMLEFYIFILKKYQNITVVGPMLQIDDLPDHYPLKQRVIESHTRQFWHKTPTHINYKGVDMQIQYAPIDTTFGMYRKSYSFKPLNSGIRTYKPYSARHLDWYIDPENLSPDQIYYLKSSSSVGHWSSTSLKPLLRK